MTRIHACIASAMLLAMPALALAADGPGSPPRGDGPGCDLFPAPASVGTTVGLSYFGPSPSTVNPSLVGPVQLLNSGKLDDQKGTITLPLYKGYIRGTSVPVWYILTDVSDPNIAAELGLNFSTKLQFAAKGARKAVLGTNNVLEFADGNVDFSSRRTVTPGPADAPFPPQDASPGSVGGPGYSPYVQISNQGGTVYNAPIVAFGADAGEINFPNGNVDYTKVHDEVVAIDPVKSTVTLQLVNGFSFGRPVWYLSMDASDPDVAAIEGATYAPLLKKLQSGGDDSFTSPVERIFISTNGPRDCANPLRQGLDAALTDGHRPNNVLGGIPTIALDYSPAWNAQFYEWTQDAVDRGYRGQLREEFQILTFVQDGVLTGPNGTTFSDSGIIINCPIVQRLN